MGGTEQTKERTPGSSSLDILEVINSHIENLEQLLETILDPEPVREEQATAEAHSPLMVALNGIESRLLRLKSRIDL